MGEAAIELKSWQASLTPARRRPIGIVAGSGPEAGVDLWRKIIGLNKQRFGGHYRGDLDAPEVIIRSDPVLGLSMELHRNETAVWERLRATARALSDTTEAYAIACNTLNYFAPQLDALALPAELVSFQSVVQAFVQSDGLSEVCLLGAAPVTALDRWSPYFGLESLLRVEKPRDAVALHSLIYDVKALGSADPSLRPRFAKILQSIESNTVLVGVHGTAADCGRRE